MAILDAIISAWRMEETSGNLIDTVGSNDLTTTAVTYQQPGKVDQAISFPGTASSARITNASQVGLNIPTAEDRTFAFWYKTSSAVRQDVIFKRDTDVSFFQIIMTSGQLIGPAFKDTSGNTVSLTGATGSLADGNWHLIIVTFTRSATGLRLYIDNVEDANSGANASTVGSVTNSHSFCLGQLSEGTDFINGLLDEVIVWNRVITAGERTTLWNSGAGTNIFSTIDVTAGVISAWQMEDASGNLTDHTGTNTLTASNLSYHQTGKVNFSTGWNGSTSSATITNGAQVGLNVGAVEDRTIAVWFKSGSAVEQTIFCKPDDGIGGPLYEIVIDGPGGVNVIFGNFPSSYAYVRSSAGYLNNTYHLAFITFTRTSVGLRLFVDNVELRSGGQPSPADASAVGDLTNSSDFRVGMRLSGSSFWNGNLDELIIWNRVLTSTERKQVWNNGNGRDIFNPPSTPSITSVTPSSSYTQGGNLVTILGSQFSVAVAPTIDFGGVVATNIQVQSSNRLTCIAPAHAQSSSVTITLTNSDTGSTTFSGFSYNAFSPSSISLKPPKYYRSGTLTFAERRNGVNNYTP